MIPRFDDWLSDDSTPETRAWEKWAETLAPGDRCLAAGRPATVTALTDDLVWVRLGGRTDAEPFEWCDVSPPDGRA